MEKTVRFENSALRGLLSNDPPMEGDPSNVWDNYPTVNLLYIPSSLSDITKCPRVFLGQK